MKVTGRLLLALCLGAAGVVAGAAPGFKRIVGEGELMGGPGPAHASGEFSKGRLSARPREARTAGRAGLQ